MSTHVQGLTPFPCISERKRGLVPQIDTLYQWKNELLNRRTKITFLDLRVVVDKFEVGPDVRVKR